MGGLNVRPIPAELGWNPKLASSAWIGARDGASRRARRRAIAASSRGKRGAAGICAGWLCAAWIWAGICARRFPAGSSSDCDEGRRICGTRPHSSAELCGHRDLRRRRDPRSCLGGSDERWQRLRRNSRGRCHVRHPGHLCDRRDSHVCLARLLCPAGGFSRHGWVDVGALAGPWTHRHGPGDARARNEPVGSALATARRVVVRGRNQGWCWRTGHCRHRDARLALDSVLLRGRFDVRYEHVDRHVRWARLPRWLHRRCGGSCRRDCRAILQQLAAGSGSRFGPANHSDSRGRGAWRRAVYRSWNRRHVHPADRGGEWARCVGGYFACLAEHAGVPRRRGVVRWPDCIEP